jgi:hypothetical protein
MASGSAEQKIDIQGFHPGMTKEMLNEQVAKTTLKCGWPIQQACGQPPLTSEKDFFFFYVSKLDRVYLVDYHFPWAASVDKLTASISTAYNKSPRSRLVWKLTDDVYMTLSPASFWPDGSGRVADEIAAPFSLRITDQRIEKEDQKQYEDGIREFLPKPKF